MGWSIDWATVVDADADWAAVTNVQDFQKAVNERHAAITRTTTVSLKNAGDDVQAHQWIEDLQTWVEARYGYFVRSHDAGVERSAGYYDDGTTDPADDVYSSLADLFSRAGLETATWRAYETHPDDGGADQSRKIQGADIIGPWLFEDLQAVLNALIWTSPTHLFNANSANNRELESCTLQTSEAAAKSAVEGNWNGTPDEEQGGDPYAYAAIERWADDEGSEQWLAQIDRLSQYGWLEVLYDGVKRDIDWYIKTQQHQYVSGGNRTLQSREWWADPETDVLEGKWSLWSQDAGTQTESQYSTEKAGAFGTRPAWPASSPDAENEYSVRGWETVDGAAVVRWNVTDGFAYT